MKTSVGSCSASLVVSLALAAALAVPSGCTIHTTPNRGACTTDTFGAGGGNNVICPGTNTCSCAAPTACCMGDINATEGECVAPQTCASFLLACDGPEDCGGGVCCITQSGSSCMPAGECAGDWVCRDDSQCAGNAGGSTCKSADFGVKGVSDRGLDGLIGICGT
jgi:hypothetical protein